MLDELVSCFVSFISFSLLSLPYLVFLSKYSLLCRSMEITDSGIMAIAHGCPDLEMINMSYCKSVTDASLISMSKCAKLNTLECRGCSLITSLGIAAIAVGCKHLTRLDIKKCININDFGVLPLAHFSQNLKEVPYISCIIVQILTEDLYSAEMTFVSFQYGVFKDACPNNVSFFMLLSPDKFVMYFDHGCGSIVPG